MSRIYRDDLNTSTDLAHANALCDNIPLERYVTTRLRIIGTAYSSIRHPHIRNGFT